MDIKADCPDASSDDPDAMKSVEFSIMLHGGEGGDGSLMAFGPDGYPVDGSGGIIPATLKEITSLQSNLNIDGPGVRQALANLASETCDTDYSYTNNNCGDYFLQAVKQLDVDTSILLPEADPDCHLWTWEMGSDETCAYEKVILAPLEDISVLEGEHVGFTVSSTNKDDSALKFAAENFPEGATFNNRAFSWTPADDQAGLWTTAFKATDCCSTGHASVDIFVVNYSDMDGDGVSDEEDAFPNNPNEYIDTDGDGIGNYADPDNDNDDLTDEEEATGGDRSGGFGFR